MNSKPLVWILYPDTPNGERTELTIYREQWSELAWWVRWWTCCLFWWRRKYIHDIPFSCSSVIVQQEQIRSYNDYWRRSSVKEFECRPNNTDAIHSLGPRSRLHLMTLSSSVHKLKKQFDQSTVQYPQSRSYHSIRCSPSQSDEWAFGHGYNT